LGSRYRFGPLGPLALPGLLMASYATVPIPSCSFTSFPSR